MNKFLNFSTILFSYVLITLLVISCGGSSGGSGGSAGSNNSDGTSGGDGSDGNDGSSGNDGTSGGGDGSGGLTQPEPKDTTCLLPDRADKDSFIAILCAEGVVIGKIENTAGREFQRVEFLIPSTSNAGGTGRSWQIPETGEIQISYSKDYNVTLDKPPGPYSQEFPIESVTIADADGHTAASPLKILTMSSLIEAKPFDSTSTYNRLLNGFIYFIPTSTVTTDSIIAVNIVVGLAVKTQADFISMANFTTISNLGSLYNPLIYFLLNDLDLIATGGEDAKFNNSIIPVAEASFAFNGSGHTITLKSAIDTTASENPAAIIGKVTSVIMGFGNLTLNINAPISGRGNVGSIVGYGEEGAYILIAHSKVNINKNITVYKSADNEDGYVGGLVGSGPAIISSSVVKTGDGAVIQAFAQNNATQNFAPAIGGLIGKMNLSDSMEDNVVDVTLGAETSDDGFAGNFISLGGLAGVIEFDEGRSAVNNNLVNLAISRGKLPADFSFDNVAGLVAQMQGHKEFANNLVYADFSNLGKVNFLGGLLGKIQGQSSDISNNMIFIADNFTGSEVQTSFGAAIALYDSTSDTVLNINNNFVSSPVTDYSTNEKLASFVHTANKDINFNNLILDNKTNTIMFKAGNEVANLQGKVGGTNGRPLFTLAEAKTDDLTTLFSAVNTSWEAFSGGYPQLKAPTDLTGAVNKAEIEAAWTKTNADIQAGLTARAASRQ